MTVPAGLELKLGDGWFRILMSFEIRPVPLSEVGSGVVSRCEERGQIGFRRAACPHRFVRQNEFREVLAVERGGGSHSGIFKSGRFGRRIRVEGRLLNRAAARPESMTDDFMGIRFFCNRV